jgi:hypothetical protein
MRQLSKGTVAARLVTFATAIVSGFAAHATQIVPTGVEYTNDTIEQGGKLQACIVDTGIISPPAPEIVNFQLLVIDGNSAFKVTAGDLDWAKKSSVAKRISDANFFTGQFNHPGAFKKSITLEGQLVGVLTDFSLNRDFFSAFFGGLYSIQFKRTDIEAPRIYEIQQAPGADIRQTFQKCIRSMRDSLK